MNFRKAQTATEYIIIVAVVIVIALVVVQIMGGFPGIGTSTSKKVSDYKLSSSDQIGVERYYFSTGSALLSLKNNYYESLRVENFTINGIVCYSNNTNISGTNSIGLPLTLNPGQTIVVNCSSTNFSLSQNDATPSVIVTYTNPTTGATYSSSIGSGSITYSSGYGNQNQPQNISQGLTVNDLRVGLVAYFALDGNTSDGSGNNNHGTNSGANYSNSGNVGGAYSFNGVDSYISLDNNTNLNLNQAITISGWVKMNNAENFGLVTKTIDDAWNEQYQVDSSAGRLRFRILKNNTEYTITSNVGAINIGEWTYFVASWNGSTMNILINGIIQTETLEVVGPLDSGSGKTYLGALAPIYGVWHFNGSVDEIAIYNRSLNSTEISFLYNNGTGQSLSQGGAYAPNCTVGQTSCNGTNYFNCSNGNWVNNGNVSGLCGYIPPANITQLRMGLVAYYPLDGNTSDESTNGNHGTNRGANYTTSGKVGGAYVFNGSGSYINTTNSSTLNLNYNISVSMWVKSSYSGDYQVLLAKSNMASTSGYGMFIHKTSGLARYNMYIPGHDIYTGNTVVSDGVWHHVVGVYNTTTISIYVDNVLSGNISDTWGAGSNTENLFIGGVPHQTVPYWTNAVLDEVAIYNRTLNSSEISYLFNNGTGLSLSLSGAQTPACSAGQSNCSGTNYINCSNGNWVNLGNVSGFCGYSDITLSTLRQGLIAYYPLDGNLSDSSVNVNHGTNSGANYTTSGKVGGGYSFNGVDSYFNGGNTNALSLSSPYAVSAWVKLNSVSDQHHRFINKGFGASSEGWSFFHLMSGQFRAQSVVGGVWQGMSLISTTIPVANTWYHVVITSNTTIAKIYVNGVEEDTSTASYDLSLPVSSNAFRIGCYENGCTNNAMNGYLDEIEVFNRSLSAAEISYLYNNGTGYSLSLSGAQTPACAAGQTNCNGTISQNCSNGNWINVGNVSGQCGYIAPVYNCTGTIPGNATLCSGDNVSLIVNTNITLPALCGAPMCEYTCNSGYFSNGISCVNNNLLQGLTAYWPLDANTSDLSGKGNNGINSGAVLNTTGGKVNGAYIFDGSSARILGNNNFTNGFTNITYSVWIKSRNITQGFIFGMGPDFGHWGAEMSVDDTSTSFVVYNLASGGHYDNYYKTGMTNSNNQWYHTVATWDSNHNMKIYFNGAEIGGTYATAGTKPTSLGNYQIELGFLNNAATRYFNGTMDEFAIYNRSLSAAEVTLLYNNGNGISLVH